MRHWKNTNFGSGLQRANTGDRIARRVRYDLVINQRADLGRGKQDKAPKVQSGVAVRS